MAHWQRVLPGRVVDVVYEELVADPEGQIRRLLALCGLPWDERCLRSHENPRPVQTASSIQVRRPIYRGALQRWRLYEKHLTPLFEALGPYAPPRTAQQAAIPPNEKLGAQVERRRRLYQELSRPSSGPRGISRNDS